MLKYSYSIQNKRMDDNSNSADIALKLFAELTRCVIVTRSEGSLSPILYIRC